MLETAQKYISQFDFFSRLSPELQSYLVKNTTVLCPTKSSRIFSHLEDSTDVYFIFKGTLKASFCSENGKDVFLNYYHEGEVFGFLSAITRLPRTSDVISVSDEVILGKLSSEGFHYIMERNAQFSTFMTKNIAFLMRDYTIRMVNQRTMSAYDIVISDIYRRYYELLEKSAHIEVPDRNTWASYLGLTRETLSRALSKAKTEKIIESDKKHHILISDIDALEKKVHSNSIENMPLNIASIKGKS